MFWRGAAAGLAVLLVIAVPPAIRHLRETPPAPEPAIRLTLEPPAGAEFGSGGLPFDLAIAPSGREMIFAATEGGESRLWRRHLDAHRAEPVANTAGATMPVYAEDGASIWFFAGAHLHRITVSSGERSEIVNAPVRGGVAVRADGTALVGTGAAIQRIAGGASSPVTTLRSGERSHAFPAWVDAGDVFVYLVTHDDGRRSIRVHDDFEDVELTRADSHGIVAAGHLLFVRDGMLRAAPLDLEARRLGAGAETMAFDVGVSPEGRGAFAVGGKVLALGSPSRRAYALQWFSDTGQPLRRISEPGDYWQVRLSPDDQTVAVTMRDPLLRTLDVFTVPADGGAFTRVTLALAADSDPAWSHDGRRLAFRSSQNGQPEIFARAVPHTAGADDPVWQSPLDEIPTEWPLAHLIFHARSPESGFDIWALAPKATAPRALVKSGFNEIDGRLSPDGRWLAYASDEGGQFDIYIGQAADGSKRRRISTAGGTRPQWVAGGRGIVFIRGREVLRAHVTEDGTGLHTTTPEPVLTLPGLRDLAASRDGRQFLGISPTESVQEDRITVVVNWSGLVQSH